jgi:preprotein translocase subunit SecE
VGKTRPLPPPRRPCEWEAESGRIARKHSWRERKDTEMGRQVAVVLYVVAMAAVIVGVDFVFFRNRFWERLTVNIGIVLVFAAFYLRFLTLQRRRKMHKKCVGR